MAYGDAKGPGYPEGTASARLSAIDLARAATGSPSLVPWVQEVTHEVTGIGTLIKQVTTAGTEVRLNATSLLVRYVHIEALETNLGDVVIGDSNVVAAAGTQGTPTMRGKRLSPGDVWAFAFNDLTNLWVDARNNGDGVSVTYFT